jgi:hypothetical protein
MHMHAHDIDDDLAGEESRGYPRESHTRLELIDIPSYAKQD